MVHGRDEAPPSAVVVVVGASAGGVEALSRLVADLDESVGAPVLVVLHVGAGESMLPRILEREGRLPAVHAADGDRLTPNKIYVAPPDRHLLISDGHVRIVRGPTENGHRPAIDPLFRSASVAFGPRTVAVILSGALDDGAAGCAAVARHGGTVVVQDPADAAYPSMPVNAIAADHPEYVVKLDKMGAAVKEAVERARTLPVEEPTDDQDAREVEASELDYESAAGTQVGDESPFSCPACGGVLREAPDDLVRFRCRVGHAYGAESLMHAQSKTIEDALWVALRALQERIELSGRLRKRMEKHGREQLAARYERQREEAERAAVSIRQALLDRDVESG